MSIRNYRTPEFGDSLFELLRSQLKLPGWSNLSDQYKPSITISKVSGSLTNAVFFVSCAYNSSSQAQPANQLPDLESPPTVLLRIYGPSSGTLISRKEELHLLHTLSAKYGIGPLLLGTFDNGRVEQFFKSRPLTKEEVRDPQISTWIARKMSELHSVDLSTVINSDQDPRTQSQSSCRANSLSSDSKWLPNSINSPSLNHSASRQSIPFPLSTVEISIQLKINCIFFSPPSALTTPQLRSLNYNNSTREGQRSLSLVAGSKSAKAGVWNNITRWQHEATKVFVDITKALEKLGIQSTSNPSLPATDEEDPLERFRATPFPLSSPQALAELVKIVDLPRLILEMKSYRAWIYNHERIHGKSPRIFSHNDTQSALVLSPFSS
jgi:choline kinase